VPLRIAKEGAVSASERGLGAVRQPRILLVEDEALVGLDLAISLKDAGFLVSGPAPSVRRALDLLGDRGCDVAVLDINLGEETSEAVALELSARGIPFVTVSGYDKSQRPPAFKGVISFDKPVKIELLVAALNSQLARF
jgi:DNA-binding response OmpR family regulator